jgi:hypothetical protein
VASTTNPLGAVKKFTYDDGAITPTGVERKLTVGNFVTQLAYDDGENVVNAQTPSGSVARAPMTRSAADPIC